MSCTKRFHHRQARIATLFSIYTFEMTALLSLLVTPYIHFLSTSFCTFSSEYETMNARSAYIIRCFSLLLSNDWH